MHAGATGYQLKNSSPGRRQSKLTVSEHCALLGCSITATPPLADDARQRRCAALGLSGTTMVARHRRHHRDASAKRMESACRGRQCLAHVSATSPDVTTFKSSLFRAAPKIGVVRSSHREAAVLFYDRDRHRTSPA
jgi:hypothetical protein